MAAEAADPLADSTLQPRNGAWGVLAAVNVVLGVGAAVVLSTLLLLVHGALGELGWTDLDPDLYEEGLSVWVWMLFGVATLFAVFAVPVNLLAVWGLPLQGRSWVRVAVLVDVAVGVLFSWYWMPSLWTGR